MLGTMKDILFDNIVLEGLPDMTWKSNIGSYSRYIIRYHTVWYENSSSNTNWISDILNLEFILEHSLATCFMPQISTTKLISGCRTSSNSPWSFQNELFCYICPCLMVEVPYNHLMMTILVLEQVVWW